MNIEDIKVTSAKQVASQAYALENFTGVENLNKIKEAWLAGYETAVPKWIKVEDHTPKDDREVVCYIENQENPDWSGNRLGAYINNKWYCKEGRKNCEIVEKWLEIPKI